MIITNPFKQKPRVEKPNRNAFDLSHAVNFTAKFGTLYPIMCKEVVPGDSFDIESVMGLRLMPLAFPVQSRMRADIHFFYVRNRNLWKDWQDFITAGKDGLTPPFIQRPTGLGTDIFGTGTLGDYLGVPTTVAVSNLNSYRSIMVSAASPTTMQSNDIPQFVPDDCSGWTPAQSYPTITSGAFARLWGSLTTNPVPGTGTIANVLHSYPLTSLQNTVSPTSKFELIAASGILPTRIYFFECSPGTNTQLDPHSNVVTTSERKPLLMAYTTASPNFVLSGGVYRSNAFSAINIKNVFYNGIAQSLDQYINEAISRNHRIDMVFEVPAPAATNPRQGKDYNNIFNGIQITNVAAPTLQEVTQISQCPYVGANPAIRINALPFRAYEAIYNSFYRNQQNDPFRINGTVEYNKYNTTLEGGADTTPYLLQNRNWEQDFLTTSLPSPQQGVAPLVGARTQGANTYTMEAEIDGVKKTLIIKADGTGALQPITNIPTGDGAGYFAESDIQVLNAAVDFGISINDFRNVNCLQKWLEKNVKCGFRYKEQILAHFGVNTRFELLGMPEFIGGFSQDIQVNSVTQTVETQDVPLGSYAGQAHAFGGSKHNVHNYFDEHGFVFAIFSVSPIPSYSQLLPKLLTKANHLDYYTPEFGHIGLQPIPMQEVTPNECALKGVTFKKVFGYQRPFYDYLAATDTVHGQMRTTCRDFLINRYFEVPPELSAKFLKIDNEECNDIFTVTDNSNDCIIGQVYFKIIAKRPISRFAEPRID